MPRTYPIATSGERQPKRARALPAGVQAALKVLVWGVESEEGRRAATLAEGAAAGNMKADTLRRWLTRPEGRLYLASEKKAMLTWATSANPNVLASIRDNSDNDSARVRAALALEEIEHPRQAPSVNVGVQVNNEIGVSFRPGYVIRLRPVDNRAEPAMAAEPAPVRPAIPVPPPYRGDAVPEPEPAERRGDPIFKPPL